MRTPLLLQLVVAGFSVSIAVAQDEADEAQIIKNFRSRVSPERGSGERSVRSLARCGYRSLPSV